MNRIAKAAAARIVEAAINQMLTDLFEDELNHGDAHYSMEEVDDIADKLAAIAEDMRASI